MHLPACLQTYVDPDEIFLQHQKTCSLDEVFANGEPQQLQQALQQQLFRLGSHRAKVATRFTTQELQCQAYSCGSLPQASRLAASEQLLTPAHLLGRPVPAGKSKQDLTRRTSSGNWIEDRVTWKEEMAYKKAMGFL